MATRRSSPPDERPALRRVPAQARSRKRFEGILDAAAALFAEQGFDATRMETIAERAGTSIGSVYQFFPNKKVLFQAMAQRLMDRESALFSSVVDAEGVTEMPWEELLDRVIETFAAYQDEEPGWLAVWTNLHLFGEVADAAREVERRFVARTAELLGFYAPELSHETRELVATVLVELVNGMLFLRSRHDAAIEEKMLDETKKLARLYVASHVRPGR